MALVSWLDLDEWDHAGEQVPLLEGPVLGLVVSCHHIETFHFGLRPTVDLAGVAD